MELYEPVFQLSLKYEYEIIAFDIFLEQPKNQFYI